MTADSKKYDLPRDEIQGLLLGLLTAVSIDPSTTLKFWTDTFPGYPLLPIEDAPSCIRLHAEIIGRLMGIIDGLRNMPEVKPYIEGLLDVLRTGETF